ncbi:MAG: hypothetical protein PHS93_05505 [Candidatus Omnitrophica bacterium]|nr:hypothetical protein [Candidatus Omnitrophota bacterium]MDD5352606.1 hypothetical protein [Candidatus Omnitrophota bacterium]MDD5550204.1 hypothetical protein [Candidatus Omnitrophota bacterium]
MLRKLIIGVIAANFVFMLVGVLTTTDMNRSGIVGANDSVASFGVGATVPQYLALNAHLYQLHLVGNLTDIDWTTNVSSLNFGSLVEVRNATDIWFMAGEKAYAVVMYPITSARPYTITETGSVLSDGLGHNIPNGAYVLNPSYQHQDELGAGHPQGAINGGVVAPPKSAVGNNQLVYTSNSSGQTRAVRAFLAITGPDASGDIKNYSGGYDNQVGQGTVQYYWHNNVGGWVPVTQDQAAGSYSGSVTFTLNLV